jgi:hypothetical protein
VGDGVTDIVAFLTARLDEQAAALIEYVEKRHTAKMSDAFSHGFMVTDASARMVLPYPTTLRSLSPYEYDAAIWLDADIASKRGIIQQWQEADAACRRNVGDQVLNAVHMATLQVVLVSLASAYRAHPGYAGGKVDDWTWPRVADEGKLA